MDFIYNLDQAALGKAGIIAQLSLIVLAPMAAVIYFKLKKAKN